VNIGEQAIKVAQNLPAGYLSCELGSGRAVRYSSMLLLLAGAATHPSFSVFFFDLCMIVCKIFYMTPLQALGAGE